jgi:hypothetical protein
MTNADRKREYMKNWQQANREKIRIYQHEYRKNNLERLTKNNRNYRKENAESCRIAASKLVKKYRMTPRGRASMLLRSARNRSKKSKCLCTVAIDKILTAIEKGTCQRTGLRFDMRPPITGHKNNPLAPSLDKIDPKGGYTDENIQVVCWQYNVMKHQLSDSELLSFCEAVVAQAEKIS